MFIVFPGPRVSSVRHNNLSSFAVCLSFGLLAAGVAHAQDPTPAPDPDLARLAAETARISAETARVTAETARRNAERDLAMAGVPTSPTPAPMPTLTSDSKVEATIMVNRAANMAAQTIVSDMHNYWTRSNYWNRLDKSNRIIIGTSQDLTAWQNAAANKRTIERLKGRVNLLNTQLDALRRHLVVGRITETNPIIVDANNQILSGGDNRDTQFSIIGPEIAAALAGVNSVTALTTAVGNLAVLVAPNVTITDTKVSASDDIFKVALLRQLKINRRGRFFDPMLASDMVPYTGTGQDSASADAIEQSVHDLIVNSKTTAKKLEQLLGAKGLYSNEVTLITGALVAYQEHMAALDFDIQKARLELQLLGNQPNDERTAAQGKLNAALVTKSIYKTSMESQPRAGYITVLQNRLEFLKNLAGIGSNPEVIVGDAPDINQTNSLAEALADEIKAALGTSATPAFTLADYQRGMQLGTLLDRGGFLLVPVLSGSFSNQKFSIHPHHKLQCRSRCFLSCI